MGFPRASKRKKKLQAMVLLAPFVNLEDLLLPVVRTLREYVLFVDLLHKGAASTFKRKGTQEDSMKFSGCLVFFLITTAGSSYKI